MIHNGRPVFYFPSSAVYIAASTFAPLAHGYSNSYSYSIYYIRPKWQTEHDLVPSLKYYQLRILPSNR